MFYFVQFFSMGYKHFTTRVRSIFSRPRLMVESFVFIAVKRLFFYTFNYYAIEQHGKQIHTNLITIIKYVYTHTTLHTIVKRRVTREL